MRPNETSPRPEAGVDRREFLRLGSALAAAGALASAGCQPPQEATIPFHDMPESLVDGMGRARFFHTVLDLAGLGAPSLIRPIKIACLEPDRILRKAGRLKDTQVAEVARTIRSFIS